jgi:hypothetical protein
VKPPETQPKPDPDTVIIKRAREVAHSIANIHDELLAELEQWGRDKEFDKEGSSRGLTGDDKKNHDTWIDKVWAQDEQKLRAAATAQYMACCKDEATSLRSQMMVKCPGILSFQQQDPLGLNVYSQMESDLRVLADAAENGCIRPKLQ